MYLPGSDVDLVIPTPSKRLKRHKGLLKLSEKLRSTFGFEQILAIGRAKFPTVKYVDSGTKINGNVWFEK